MCGIIGAWGASADRVQAASELQRHRGPDDHGYYRDPDVPLSLAQVRLSIIDVSPLGHQPMLSGDESVVIVYNGEIYNFRELRAELEDGGYSFKGHSDTEVLLAGYLRDGVSILPRLNGIFAFAIWDRRTHELFLARDALGVKPLYYRQDRDGFSFASEMKALLSMTDDPGGLDAVSLHRYMSFLWCPGEGTPLKGVRKMLPGEAMILREGKIARRWLWYQLPGFRVRQSGMDENNAIRGTEEELRKAVHRQLVADVPVGAFLSGGLDSSAVVAMARERAPEINCFTIESAGGAEDGFIDDLPYARLAARHLGVPLEVVSIDSSRMAAGLEDMVYSLDEPLADPAPLNVFYISRLASEHGMKVLLSGAGGDDLFTGYRRHVALGIERLWSWLPADLLKGLDKAASGLDQRKPLFRRIARLFAGAGLNGNAGLVKYFAWVGESQLLALYTPEFRDAIGTESAWQPMLDFLESMPETASRLECMLALEQRFFLADHNLIYTDKMSMAAGVEVRVPFLDLELVEFAAKIPAKFKLKKGQVKWVLKKAMEPYLPRNVIYRSKTGFGAPLRRWMRFELRELLGDMLSEDSLRKRGLFDADAVQRLISQNDSGRMDASYILLSLLCIEIWCRRFLDRKTRQRIAR